MDTDAAFTALSQIQEIVQSMYEDLTDEDDFDSTVYAADLDEAIRVIAKFLNG